MVEQVTNQLSRGGSTPTLPLQLAEIPSCLARTIVEKNHYSHIFPQAVKLCHGAIGGQGLCGVSVYSISSNRHAFSCLGLVNGWELSRLWYEDGHDGNALSRFVSISLRKLPVDNIISYADGQQNHVGYIYQALNFIYVGETGIESRFIHNGQLITRRHLGRKIGHTERGDREELLRSGAVMFKSKPKYKYVWLKDKHKRADFASAFGKPYPKNLCSP